MALVGKLQNIRDPRVVVQYFVHAFLDECSKICYLNVFSPTFCVSTSIVHPMSNWQLVLNLIIATQMIAMEPLPHNIYPFSTGEGQRNDQLLKQNFPNPFTCSTEIGFCIPYSSQVKLDIFDSNGQMVMSLFSRKMSAGDYTAEWDRSKTAGAREPGNYICRLLIVNESGILMNEMFMNAI